MSAPEIVVRTTCPYCRTASGLTRSGRCGSHHPGAWRVCLGCKRTVTGDRCKRCTPIVLEMDPYIPAPGEVREYLREQWAVLTADGVEPDAAAELALSKLSERVTAWAGDAPELAELRAARTREQKVAALERVILVAGGSDV